MENECVPYLSGWHGFHIVGRAQCAPAQCSIMGLRAHTVRPSGYASANDFDMGTPLDDYNNSPFLILNYLHGK